jgi:hypothetical protein
MALVEVPEAVRDRIAALLQLLAAAIGWPSRPSTERGQGSSPGDGSRPPAKFYLGPARQAPRPLPADSHLIDHESGDLPHAYGHDRIVALSRDPWWIFAYWEVTPASRARVLGSLGGGPGGPREVLRVSPITPTPGEAASFAVEPPPATDRWYLNVPRPATPYYVEIGLVTPAGRFVPFARSNPVSTPRPGPSSDTTAVWVELGARAAPREDLPVESMRSSDQNAPWPPAR